MPNFSEQDKQFIRAAEGWLELGDHLAAFEELENVAPLNRAEPIVLALRWQIYAKAGRWDSAFAVADGLAGAVPQRVEPFIWRSYSARRMPGGGLQSAFDLLHSISKEFPDEPALPLNLACYASQLGQREQARTWLHVAFGVTERKGETLYWKQQSLDDADLEPLRREHGLE